MPQQNPTSVDPHFSLHARHSKVRLSSTHQVVVENKKKSRAEWGGDRRGGRKDVDAEAVTGVLWSSIYIKDANQKTDAIRCGNYQSRR